MKNLPHVASLLYEHPWAITESGLQTLASIYEAKIHSVETEWLKEFNAAGGDVKPKREAFQVVNGTAIIPIAGPIIPKATLFSKISGVSSFDEIVENMRAAESRSDVSALLFHADSPGGSVLGCFEAASEIYNIRQNSSKPLLALVNGQGCSACYVLVSQCDEVYATEGSSVGSIGVIAKVENKDRQEKNLGNDIVVFRSAELKSPGVGPMTPSQMSAVQKKMMVYDAMFDSAVKRGRPNIDLEKVSTGETWIGAEAVAIGVVDGVSTLEKILAKISG